MEARLTIPCLGYMDTPVCAEPESSVPKRHRSDITVGQKREICLYKLQNPGAKNATMALHFSQLYGTSIGRSTIGDIIKRAAHWLSQSDHIVNTTRKISPGHFELEKQLYEFTTEAQGRGMKVTDEMLLRKAREIGERVGVPADFKYSRGWLSNCKKRTNKLIYDDTHVTDSIMVDVGCAEDVIQQLMANNSSKDSNSGKQKQKAAKRKRPEDEGPHEPQPVSCAVCNVSLLTTHGHKHLDDVVHDYSRTPNPPHPLVRKTVRARLEPLLEAPLDGSSWLCSMCYTTLVQLEEYNNLLALYRERHRSTVRLQRQLCQNANHGAHQDSNQCHGQDVGNRESEKDGCPSSKRSKGLKQCTLLQSYMGSLGLARHGDQTVKHSGRTEPQPPSLPSSSPSSQQEEVNLENVIKNIISQQSVDLSTLSTDMVHNTHLEAVIRKMLDQQQQQQTGVSVSSSCSPSSTSPTHKDTCRVTQAVTDPSVSHVPQMETESDDLLHRQPMSPIPAELDGTMDTDSIILGGGYETLFLRRDKTGSKLVWRPWKKDDSQRDMNERGESEVVSQTVQRETVNIDVDEDDLVHNGTGRSENDENERIRMERTKVKQERLRQSESESVDRVIKHKEFSKTEEELGV